MRGAAVEETRPRSAAMSVPQRPGRLCTKGDFSRVFSRPGRVLRGRYFKILATRNDRSIPRLGTAIARKHTRTAVRRNLLKRLAREAVRCHCAALAGWDLVILSQPPAGTAERRQLREELEILLRRLTGS